jgi:hypothetical protein
MIISESKNFMRLREKTEERFQEEKVREDQEWNYYF